MKRVGAVLVFVIYVTVRPAYRELTMQRQYGTFNNDIVMAKIMILLWLTEQVEHQLDSLCVSLRAKTCRFPVLYC